jgi:hypothetical protein
MGRIPQRRSFTNVSTIVDKPHLPRTEVVSNLGPLVPTLTRGRGLTTICGKVAAQWSYAANQPLIEHEPQTDQRNPYPWYDITCCSIIATVQIVPDDKPVEPSSAILNGASGK